MNKDFLKKQSSQENKPKVRVVINTFTGNSLEYDHSAEVMRLLKIKNVRISEVIDVNQELVFSKENKIKFKIREHFHRTGKLFKVNSKFPLPQVIINETLVLSYYEVCLLNELVLLDKLFNGLICEHIRFFDNKLVYQHDPLESSVCVYCYSLKKKRQMVTIICNSRDYNDEETNEILSFCEKNELTFQVLDYENTFEKEDEVLRGVLEKKEKCLIIDEEVLPFSSFYESIENKLLSKQVCYSCSVCAQKLDISLGLRKCFDCMINKSEAVIKCGISYDCKKSNSKAFNSAYNFIDKLQLKKKDFDTHEHDLKLLLLSKSNSSIKEDCSITTTSTFSESSVNLNL